MSPKKKRVYLATVFIGAGALLVDSFVLSSGVPQVAYPAPAENAAAEESDPAGDLAIPELPFPRGIKPIDPNAEIPDLFAPPKVRGDGQSEGSDADKSAAAVGRLSAPGHLSSSAFEANHHLDGVLVDQRLRIAGLDGQWITAGTSIDGCTLIRIAPREVTFRCFDNSVTLTLDGMAGGPQH